LPLSPAIHLTKTVGKSVSSLETGANGRLTWPEYLDLRKQQRRYALFATIPITTLGLTLGVNYFATIEAAPTDLIMGIEAPYVSVISSNSINLPSPLNHTHTFLVCF
jgi:import inner membrane translocase subunit TIM23